jgi:sulfite exporter TauE/SafE
MTSLLLLGFIIGMRHALEADHVAAVAALVSDKASTRETARHGALWGLGHTLTLFILGGGVLILGIATPDPLNQWLEFCVGILQVVLGLDVLYRIRRKSVRLTPHCHGGFRHFHAVRGLAPGTAPAKHQHRPLPPRALLVGMMHGMAGSAALVVLTVETVASPWQGLLYIVLFGLGSTLGMLLLAAAISLPIQYSRRWSFAFRSLQSTVGLASMGVGGWMMYEIGWAGGLLG